MKSTAYLGRHWIHRFRHGASVCILCSTFAGWGTASANLIVNGGFEAALVPTGGFQTFSVGSSFGGWNVVGAAGNVGPISGAYTLSGLSFPAQEGGQFVDLTGLSNTATGIEQAVTTSAGIVYDLSFWVGNMVNPGGLFGSTSTVELFVEGVSRGTFTNANGTGTGRLDWQSYAISFVALDASTSIRFLNRDGSTDNANGLDNVMLVARGGNAPEPGSAALCAASLFALGLASRRRKAATSPGRGCPPAQSSGMRAA